jgi:predicted molibdopterin-dependent oxidoreductase YjgC
MTARQATAASATGAQVAVRIDGRPVAVPAGTLVAAALEIAAAGHGGRRAVGGARRQAFCGMGVCGECRVTVDGQPHRLGCQVACADGMEIRSDD